MDDPARRRSRDIESRPRRLRTPDQRANRTATRSRSRARSRSSTRRRRDSHRQDVELGQQRIDMLENELQRERDRLRESQARRHRTPSRPANEPQDAERRDVAGNNTRSRSPSFSKKDMLDILKCFKDSIVSQPSTQGAQSFQKIDNKNILPCFDPSAKNQRIDVWLKKVNECASVYGWDDKTTTHFAMQKLQGLAKIWYEGLSTILYTWTEWQDKLVSAFPYEQNYGQALEEMLKRKSRFNEPIESYYYEKMYLVTQCDIVGKRAVDCIIHGLTDRTLRSGALALRCSHPDQLLQYLMSNKNSSQFTMDKGSLKNRNFENFSHNSIKPGSKATSASTVGCYNCKEKGHSFLYCPKPIIRCSQCHKVGHNTESCRSNVESKTTNNGNVQKTMCIDSFIRDVHSKPSPNAKYLKEVRINGATLKAFVDFGSDVTLIKESVIRDLQLKHNHEPTPMKGFGNGVVESLGELTLKIDVEGVEARVACKVVSDNLLDLPVLIGQSFTEQPQIVVYKTSSKLQFIDVGSEMPSSEIDTNDDLPIKVSVAKIVELYGVASVMAKVEDSFTGNVLVKDS